MKTGEGRRWSRRFSVLHALPASLHLVPSTITGQRRSNGWDDLQFMGMQVGNVHDLDDSERGRVSERSTPTAPITNSLELFRDNMNSHRGLRAAAIEPIIWPAVTEATVQMFNSPRRRSRFVLIDEPARRSVSGPSEARPKYEGSTAYPQLIRGAVIGRTRPEMPPATTPSTNGIERGASPRRIANRRLWQGTV